MKKINRLLMVCALAWASLAGAEENIDKKAADEYFKHAGQATDPGFQDYVATTQKKEEEAAKKEQEKKNKKGD